MIDRCISKERTESTDSTKLYIYGFPINCDTSNKIKRIYSWNPHRKFEILIFGMIVWVCTSWSSVFTFPTLMDYYRCWGASGHCHARGTHGRSHIRRCIWVWILLVSVVSLLRVNLLGVSLGVGERITATSWIIAKAWPLIGRSNIQWSTVWRANHGHRTIRWTRRQRNTMRVGCWDSMAGIGAIRSWLPRKWWWGICLSW